jgi:hypothetical protein
MKRSRGRDRHRQGTNRTGYQRFLLLLLVRFSLTSPSEAAGRQFVESIGLTDFLTSIPPCAFTAIETTLLLLNLGEESLEVTDLRCISLHPGDAFSYALDRRSQLLLAPTGDEDVGSFGRETLRGSKTNPACPTGDKCDPSTSLPAIFSSVVILCRFQRCHHRQSVRAFSSCRSLDIHSWVPSKDASPRTPASGPSRGPCSHRPGFGKHPPTTPQTSARPISDCARNRCRGRLPLFVVT